MRMGYIVICDLPGSVLFFYIISETARFSEKSKIKCVFWFSLQILPEKSLILRRIEGDMIKKMYIAFYVKYDFNVT
jgi:hypothetical protein